MQDDALWLPLDASANIEPGLNHFPNDAAIAHLGYEYHADLENIIRPRSFAKIMGAGLQLLPRAFIGSGGTKQGI